MLCNSVFLMNLLCTVLSCYFSFDKSLPAANFKVGSNGQLPNLDLVNIVVGIAAMDSLPITLFDHLFQTDALSFYFETYWTSLRKILAMMRRQALGLPCGMHSLFHRFGQIENHMILCV